MFLIMPLLVSGLEKCWLDGCGSGSGLDDVLDI